jgi:hypothetical protein
MIRNLWVIPSFSCSVEIDASRGTRLFFSRLKAALGAVCYCFAAHWSLFLGTHFIENVIGGRSVIISSSFSFFESCAGFYGVVHHEDPGCKTSAVIHFSYFQQRLGGEEVSLHLLLSCASQGKVMPLGLIRRGHVEVAINYLSLFPNQNPVISSTFFHPHHVLPNNSTRCGACLCETAPTHVNNAEVRLTRTRLWNFLEWPWLCLLGWLWFLSIMSLWRTAL